MAIADGIDRLSGVSSFSVMPKNCRWRQWLNPMSS